MNLPGSMLLCYFGSQPEYYDIVERAPCASSPPAPATPALQLDETASPALCKPLDLGSPHGLSTPPARVGSVYVLRSLWRSRGHLDSVWALHHTYRLHGPGRRQPPAQGSTRSCCICNQLHTRRQTQRYTAVPRVIWEGISTALAMAQQQPVHHGRVCHC